MDGQQPIMGAHVYLFAANTTGYGQSSVPLLSSAGTGYADSLGGYVLTASDGTFTLPGGYTCKSTDQVYAYVLGGNAGLGVNSAIGELTVIGSCPLTSSTTPSFVWINEVSTIAAAYAMAGFANDAIHVSSSGTALAQTGITNAFAAAANLAALSTGTAWSVIPSGNASVPQSEINTLANMLAACIHSPNSGSSSCRTLLSNTDAGGVVPTDTASAAINIAHSPANNAAALYALQTSSSPYLPSLTAAPNDFSIALNFITISGLGNSVSIDASGNVWMANGLYSIIKLSSSGYLLSGANGYTDGLNRPGWVAIDLSGDAWVGQNSVYPSVPVTYSFFEFSNSGDLLSPANGYTGGGLDDERDIAIDGEGNVWTTNISGNSVSKFSSQGVPLSGSGGFAVGGMNFPLNIAIDISGNAWITNNEGNTVIELSSSGNILSGTGYTDGGSGASTAVAIDSFGNVWVNYANGNSAKNRVVKFSSTGQALSVYSGAGVGNGVSLAIDGANNIWIPNYWSDSIGELSNSGSVLSGPNGYTSNAVSAPWWIAIDGSGNAWVNCGDILGSGNLVEYIGIATPVVTPLSVGVKNKMLGTRP